jgi:hypothetical protein
VFFIQIYFERFLITYLGPDGLAAFRLASPRRFGGPFKRQVSDPYPVLGATSQLVFTQFVANARSSFRRKNRDSGIYRSQFYAMRNLGFSRALNNAQRFRKISPRSRVRALNANRGWQKTRGRISL